MGGIEGLQELLFVTYAEKLQDPLWQEKRKEIIYLAECACESCNRKDRPLQVHHKYYDGREPWDYLWTELVCLCDECHKQTERALQESRKLMADLDWKDIIGFVEDFRKASSVTSGRAMINFIRFAISQPEKLKKILQ